MFSVLGRCIDSKMDIETWRVCEKFVLRSRNQLRGLVTHENKQMSGSIKCFCIIQRILKWFPISKWRSPICQTCNFNNQREHRENSVWCALIVDLPLGKWLLTGFKFLRGLVNFHLRFEYGSNVRGIYSELLLEEQKKHLLQMC